MKIGMARHLCRPICASDINVALLSSFGVNFVQEYSVESSTSKIIKGDFQCFAHLPADALILGAAHNILSCGAHQINRYVMTVVAALYILEFR